LKPRTKENILKQTHYKAKVFWNWQVTIPWYFVGSKNIYIIILKCKNCVG
jgi:hypothetical protein